MAPSKNSYVFNKKDNDDNNIEMSGSKISKLQYSYEEALEITGHGKYNYGLLITCFVLIIAMGIDIFGLGIIVTASTCDLNLTLSQIGILSSMSFAGIIVMSYPWGYLSDTRGRRLVLMWAMSGSFISSAISSLSPSWQVLAALRFISSALSSAAESATYALIGECCGVKVRAKYMLLITSALMITPTLYYITAYLIMKLDFTYYLLGIEYRPWRLLTLIMALPLGLSALLLWYFSESPKFLANVGRNEEAVKVLKRIYVANGHDGDEFPVKQIYLEDGNKEEVGVFSLHSLWTQIAPLFKPPLLWKTALLYYLTFVTYIANNSFAIILPTIFNIFFTSYATSAADASFCDLFHLSNTTTSDVEMEPTSCKNSIEDNTIWAGCAHGMSFFLLNALISQFAGKRKPMTIVILLIAAAAGVGINNTGEAISGLVLFYIFLTTAMVFGIISSYFVDLYPTSYRGMIACLGMMVARLSAFAGTNILSGAMTDHCSVALYSGAGIVLSGAVAALFLPSDRSIRS
ncbi:putative transporter svop-1 [Spodoptera litura]|uniref:Transporter svop-1 n=1 Tax=Spodoptera litura TaxID=69820 RepID=A0A9J7ED67_SPOLT|nr:putative transporter svop-1 [Spodoptera litura]